MKRVLGLLGISFMALTACAVDTGDEGVVDDEMMEQSDISPVAEGKAIMPIRGAAGTQTANATGYGIVDHGGGVMANGVNVYYIWYGNWANHPATTVLTDLASSIGGSSYYNINTTYGTPNKVTYKGAYYDNYSQGTTSKAKTLSDSQIYTIVKNAITGGKFNNGSTVADPDGLYFVLTSADVSQRSTGGAFCTSYCGWHASSTMQGLATIGGVNTKFSFVGNPETKCPSSCSAVTATTAPNGNLAADAMASIIAHELEEAASDPDGHTWYDTSGYENADKCAWTFGTTSTNGGRVSNMTIGARSYYIQRNWLNAGPSGSCAQSY